MQSVKSKLRVLWQPRKSTVVVLIYVVSAWFISNLQYPLDERVLNDYGLSPSVVNYCFLFLVALLLLLVSFPSQFHSFFDANRKIAIGLLAVVALLSFATLRLVTPIPARRLFEFPTVLGLLITSVISVCSVLIWVVTKDAIERDLKRVVTVVVGMCGLLLVVVHIGSTGEFMRLDIPDEPWLASMATNYAENGDLSPSFLASAYGSPDPALGRYYWLLGVWLRLVNSTSLVALRAFPLLVGGFTALLFTLMLWRMPSLAIWQRLVGVVTLLGLMPFVRTTHNLRMDIGLSVYSVLWLWVMLRFFEGQNRSRWLPFGLGFASYIGLETVPTLIVPLAVVIGAVFIVWSLKDPRQRWAYVAAYLAGGELSVLLYLLVHFFPNFSEQWSNFREFSSTYASGTGFGEYRDVLNYLLIQMSFSLRLSPIELPITLIATAFLWVKGTRAERIILIVVLLQIVVMLTILNTTFGYWVLFAPLIAYAMTRTVQVHGARLIVSLVFIPALVSLPVKDMGYEMQRRANSQTVAQAEAQLADIPEGIAIVGEPLFWFNLHRGREFVAWTGVGRFARSHSITMLDFLDLRDVRVVIVWSGYEDRLNQVIDSGMFETQREIIVDSQSYYVFQR